MSSCFRTNVPHLLDGKHTAVEFRRRFLSHLDNLEAWKLPTEPIILDFKYVKKSALLLPVRHLAIS